MTTDTTDRKCTKRVTGKALRMLHPGPEKGSRNMAETLLAMAHVLEAVGGEDLKLAAELLGRAGSIILDRFAPEDSKTPATNRRPTLADATAELLVEVGNPMTLRQIVIEMAPDTWPDGDLAKMARKVGRALRRDGRFRRLDRGIYGLASQLP